MTITTTVHLRAGTPEEYLVEVAANVSLFAGRYRIDKLEVTGGGAAVIAPRDLDDAYEQIIEAVRPKGLDDPARRERGSILLPTFVVILFLTVIWALVLVRPELPKQENGVPPSASAVISYTHPQQLEGGHYSPALITIKHDNHWFVTFTLTDPAALLHHPDCPCGGAKGVSTLVPLPLESPAQGR